MKKYLLIVLALSVFVMSRANPLPNPPPNIWLSELGFDSNGIWTIELGYNNIWNENTFMPVDSIFISASNGRAKLKNLSFKGESGVMMVTTDSLMSDLNINPVGDSIQIEYYCMDYTVYNKKLTNPVVFGNYRNATLKAPKTGESIACYPVFSSLELHYWYVNYENFYSLDLLPNFGAENDSSGMCATLKGNIFDENNKILLNFNRRIFARGIADFYPKSDGSYSVRVFSAKNQISQLFYVFAGSRYIVDIIPINLDLKPDSVGTADIHIQKITSVQEVKTEQVQLLRIAPNPVRGSVFNYEIFLPIKSSECYLELVSLKGQRIAQFSLLESKGLITVPSEVENGMYILTLYINKKNYGTSKILISR
ncbi:T9SS type A sorting domain-containing protein [Saccharicrinis sp. FJH62]|uniref:T9SS type A sorting domain-containing protein n=1 Tax=Saccharicrinis sp. FJH62 TaxID=3344657 RepID=UPI0035D41F40